MALKINLGELLKGCADDSFDDGIRIDTELEPLSGPGGSVKPAVYKGGKYQTDRRWASPDDDESTPVIVIDNVPSQANRLEEALRRDSATPVPELVLDLSSLSNLPAHLPRQLSSLEFPHRNADAYLRDAKLGDDDFTKTKLGQAIFGATPQECGPLMAWFPQALLYGFWQSHLGNKRHFTKHARSWVSEIVGWQPAAMDIRLKGVKGDPLNLNVDEKVLSDPHDLTGWSISQEKRRKNAEGESLSDIGHGQVLFKEGDEAPAASLSFERITQRATVSFAQLRRISLGPNNSKTDVAARALLVALGLHAHLLAFGRGFALRSGAELRPKETTAMWLGSEGDNGFALGDAKETGEVLEKVLEHARSVGVPLDGWNQPPILLTPKEDLCKVIRATWPDLED